MASNDDQSRKKTWLQLWELIVKARSGDKQAATDLIGEEKIFKTTKVIAASLRRGRVDGDYKDKDDLHHDILLKIVDKITDFKGESKGEFWCWLRMLARGKQSREWERVGKERIVFDKNGLEDTERSCTADPYSRVLISELLCDLKPLHRDIFILHVDGYRLKEIAEILNKPKTTVDRYLKKTQKALKNKLENSQG